MLYCRPPNLGKDILKIIAALMAAFMLVSFATPAQAQTHTDDTRNRTTSDKLLTTVAKMDDAQKQELLNKATDIEQGNSNVAATREWIEIGRSLGAGLAATARELGVEVNKFAQSPVGKLAIVLIVWNFMGETIIHFFAAFILLAVFLPVWFRIFRGMYGKFNEAGKLVGYDMDNQGEGTQFFSWASGLVIVVMAFTAIMTA